MAKKIIKLKHPFEYGSELVSTITLRRLKGREFRTIQSGDPSMDEMLNLLASLAGQPPTLIDEMDAEDIQACFEAMADFLPGGQKTSRQR